MFRRTITFDSSFATIIFVIFGAAREIVGTRINTRGLITVRTNHVIWQNRMIIRAETYSSQHKFDFNSDILKSKFYEIEVPMV